MEQTKSNVLSLTTPTATVAQNDIDISYVVGRESECTRIHSFVVDSLNRINGFAGFHQEKKETTASASSGSTSLKAEAKFLYICGSSGTGKTMTIFHLFQQLFGCNLERFKFENGRKAKMHGIKGFSYVNAMRCSKPKDVFCSILQGVNRSEASLDGDDADEENDNVMNGNENADKAMTTLQNMFILSNQDLTRVNGVDDDDKISSFSSSSKRRKMENVGSYIVVIDEIDQLVSDDQSVLYTLFGWAINNRSNLILIGIANRVDLHDKYLPKLSAYAKTEISVASHILIFKAYTDEQLVDILSKSLMKEYKCDEESLSKIITKDAIKMCAKKIAAKSGDCRRALYICRCAISKNMKEDGTPGNPVSISNISSAVKVLESPFVTLIQSLPQYCKYALIGLARFQKGKGDANPKNAIPGQSALNSFNQIIQELSLPRVESSIFFDDVLPQLQSNGLVSVIEKGKAKVQIKSKKEMNISLQVQMDDIVYACNDSSQLKSLLKQLI